MAKPAGKDKALSSDQLDVWREILTEKGPHVDMHDLRERMALGNKQPYISVHEAQDIQRRLSLTAHAGGWKVQVIYGAQFMRVDTANKLLKLLEEPPKKTLFVLLADNTEALLATILSRTQIISVPPIPAEAVRRQLETEGGAPEAITDAVSLCDGDLAEARRLMQTDAAAEFDMFVEWMRTCYAQDGRKAAGLADRFHDLGREPQKQFLAYALHMVRQCIVGNYGAKSAVRLRAAEAGSRASLPRSSTMETWSTCGHPGAGGPGSGRQRLRPDRVSRFEHADDGTSPAQISRPCASLSSDVSAGMSRGRPEELERWAVHHAVRRRRKAAGCRSNGIAAIAAATP